VRILYFSRDYTTHDHRFLSALAQTEHQVFFLRLERRGHALEDRSLPPQIEQVRWEGGQAPARFQDGPRLWLGLRRVIQKIQPDLVHAGPIQRCAFLTALTGFRPLVSMSWGYDLLFDANTNFWWRWATRYTLQRSAVMVGDCETIRRLAVDHGMAGDRVVTFPWGIDLQHFTPEKLERRARTENSPFTLLSTRSWEPIYGVDVIARAFVQAARQLPELRLMMLGNGSQGALLHQIFHSAGVLDRVTFPGQVKYDNLPNFYRMADVYLSASHSDGTSISLLEAMACGRPVILSDIPGNREWVEPGVNGWLFADGDVNALAERILTAAAGREDLEGMGRQARSVTERRADWQQNFPRLLQAYQMAQTGGRSGNSEKTKRKQELL